MEKCLCPISDNQIEFLELTLNRYLPLARADDLIDPTSSGPEDSKGRSLPRSRVRVMCHHLLLAILRYYREKGLQEKWNATCRKIENIATTMSPEYRARFHYERALAALFALNPQDVKEKIDEWPIDESLPFWEAKRAGLLAEIGQLREAARILEGSLAAIRKKSNLKPVTSDYTLASQESIVMLLLRSVQVVLFLDAQASSKYPDTEEFTARWHALRQYGCDPWGEIESFERALDGPVEPKATTKHRHEFDIGIVTQTQSFQSEDTEKLNAYGFLRFCEDAGIPFRLDTCTIATKSAAGALSRIAPHSPYWAMATLIRLDDTEAVDRVFDRASLARMDTRTVDALVDRYLKALDFALADIRLGTGLWDHNFGILLAKVVPEILSRLCCKCSSNTVDLLLDFLAKVYRSDRRRYYRGIRHLTERLLAALSVHERIDAIPRLLALPVLVGLNYLEEQEYRNPFAFLEIERGSLSNTVTVNEADVDRLINTASSNDPKARRWALLTLGRLHSWGLLGQWTERFADALWDRLDDTGMPSQTDYFACGFLTLPHPAQHDPISKFRTWVLNARFPVQAERESGARKARGRCMLCQEFIGARKHIEWSSEETAAIVRHLISWWDADKKYLNNKQTGPLGLITDELRLRLSKLVSTLVAVIRPSFETTGVNDMPDALRRVVREMSDQGFPTLRLESACVHLFPGRRADLIQRIEAAMASSPKETVIDALGTLWILVERIDTGTENRANSDFLRILGVASQVVRWRREHGLPIAINTLAGIAKMYPWAFAADIESSVLEGLHHLVEETAIHAPSSAHLYADDGPEVATKLMVRRAAAGLAYTLSNHYHQCGGPAPAVIEGWAAICRSDDEFAEVRNQWIARDPE